jgi:glutamate--cysteine ligase
MSQEARASSRARSQPLRRAEHQTKSRDADVTTTTTPDEPIRRYEDLFRLFHDAEKPGAEHRVGAEMEKFGVDATTGTPIAYDGPRGVLRILEALAEHGWQPERETDDGPIIALHRDGASITLEPGSQLELSGAPFRSVHEIRAELDTHLTELKTVSKEMNLRWLGLGFHPFARRSDLTFVPKQRYAIMREYLPTRGGHGLDMMLRTCTVQANFDYASEADAMRKMRVSLRLAPLTTAIFANSPWYEGERFGGVSYRAKVWLDVDPDRSGLLPALWSESAGYAEYVEWALDAPMFMFKRGGEPVANTGQTFRSFWKDGFQGHRPLLGDWQTHVNTLFPEVRLKRTIEIRGADAQTQAMACALPALWTGIFYDERALSEAEALSGDFTHDETKELRTRVWRDGLRATFRGAPLAKLARRVVEIAEAGLERRAYKTKDGARDERVHLARVHELLAHDACPADWLLAALPGDPMREILEHADLSPAY